MKTQKRRDRLQRPVTASPSHLDLDATAHSHAENGDDGSDSSLDTAKGETVSRLASRKNAPTEGAATAPHEPDVPVTTVEPQRTLAPILPKRRQRRDLSGSTLVQVEEPTTPVRATELPARSTPTGDTEEVVSHAPWRLFLTYQNLLWIVFFALAFATRFWDLGSRGIHHDESLHSHFSRLLYAGSGYTHDPMMHGPLQFHLIGFMYWLFGTTDATARFASAFCGVFVVMSPFFLQRQMGRIAALVCSFLLLVSPSLLYFSRMAREDAIFSAMEMIMIVGLWRFISTRRPADFYIFCAGLSLMFTIKETAYLTVAILGGLFVLLFAFQAGYAILGALGGYFAALGGLLFFVKGNTIARDQNNNVISGFIPELPNIPATNPNYDTITKFTVDLLTHPLIWGSALITLGFLAVLAGLFRAKRNQITRAYSGRATAGRTPVDGAVPVRRRRSLSNVSGAGATVPIKMDEHANGHSDIIVNGTGAEAAPAERVVAIASDGEEVATPTWDTRRLDPKPNTLLAHYEAGSLPHLIGSLFARPSVLLIGFAIAATIFTVFYTVFFTDTPRGIASGLFASLGYWMAQHEVERGGQPWFYYLLLIPLYEPIATFFSVVAATFFSWRGIRWLLRRRSARQAEPTQRLGAFNLDRPVPFAQFGPFLVLFIGWWLAGTLFIYSWAGEKMPWLMVHMVRPGIFLASLFIGALLVSLIARRKARMQAAAATPVMLESEPVSTEKQADRKRQVQRVPVKPVRPKQEPPWITWNRPGSVFPVVSFLILFCTLAFAWGLTMNALIFRNDYGSWGLTWMFPLAMVAVTVAYGVWLGVGRSLRYLALGLLSMMLFYQVKSAVNLSYNQPDVPKEMAVYVQTSPDMARLMRNLDTYSNLTAGGKNIKVIYDHFASWPFEWYLRDYKNKVFIGEGQPQMGPDVPVMLLEYGDFNSDKLKANISDAQREVDAARAEHDRAKAAAVAPNATDAERQAEAAALGTLQAAESKLDQATQFEKTLSADYVGQRYPMRWWFPQEWYMEEFMPGLSYKTSPATSQIGAALNTIAGTITNPNNQATLWKYLTFRETPKPLGSEDLMLFLRRDAAQPYYRAQYKPPPSTDLP